MNTLIQIVQSEDYISILKEGISLLIELLLLVATIYALSYAIKEYKLHCKHNVADTLHKYNERYSRDENIKIADKFELWPVYRKNARNEQAISIITNIGLPVGKGADLRVEIYVAVFALPINGTLTSPKILAYVSGNTNPLGTTTSCGKVPVLTSTGKFGISFIDKVPSPIFTTFNNA